MKHAISVPSVLTGRRVRWSLELSVQRREIPPSGSSLAREPQTAALSEAAPVAQTARRTSAFSLVAATLVVGVVAALAVMRHWAPDEEYEVADPSFALQASTDRDATVEPIASTPVTRTPAAAAPVVAALVTPSVRPSAVRPAAAEAPSTAHGVSPKIVAASAPAPTTVVTRVVDTHETEEASTPASDGGAIGIPPTAAPTAAAAVDEVTITGCLESAKDDDRFRLADTEGANVPQARSWKSGFFKKRSAPVDLIAPADGLSLDRDVGRRVAATGVLSSRKLKVSSVRVVAPSCN